MFIGCRRQRTLESRAAASRQMAEVSGSGEELSQIINSKSEYDCCNKSSIVVRRPAGRLYVVNTMLTMGAATCSCGSSPRERPVMCVLWYAAPGKQRGELARARQFLPNPPHAAVSASGSFRAQHPMDRYRHNARWNRVSAPHTLSKRTPARSLRYGWMRFVGGRTRTLAPIPGRGILDQDHHRSRPGNSMPSKREISSMSNESRHKELNNPQDVPTAGFGLRLRTIR